MKLNAFIKMIFQNNKGMGMVGAIVLMSLVTFIGAYIVSSSHNTQKLLADYRIKTTSESMIQSVKVVLNDKAICTASILHSSNPLSHNVFNLDPNQRIKISFDLPDYLFLKNSSGTHTFSLGEGAVLESYSLEVKNLYFQNSKTIDDFGANERVYSGTINFDLVKIGSNFGGKYVRPRPVPMIIRVSKVTNKVTSCYGEVSSAGICEMFGGVFIDTVTPPTTYPGLSMCQQFPCHKTKLLVFDKCHQTSDLLRDEVFKKVSHIQDQNMILSRQHELIPAPFYRCETGQILLGSQCTSF